VLGSAADPPPFPVGIFRVVERTRAGERQQQRERRYDRGDQVSARNGVSPAVQRAENLQQPAAPGKGAVPP